MRSTVCIFAVLVLVGANDSDQDKTLRSSSHEKLEYNGEHSHPRLRCGFLVINCGRNLYNGHREDFYGDQHLHGSDLQELYDYPQLYRKQGVEVAPPNSRICLLNEIHEYCVGGEQMHQQRQLKADDYDIAQIDVNDEILRKLKADEYKVKKLYAVDPVKVNKLKADEYAINKLYAVDPKLQKLRADEYNVQNVYSDE